MKKRRRKEGRNEGGIVEVEGKMRERLFFEVINIDSVIEEIEKLHQRQMVRGE